MRKCTYVITCAHSASAREENNARAHVRMSSLDYQCSASSHNFDLRMAAGPDVWQTT